jgi:hypothetical protein
VLELFLNSEQGAGEFIRVGEAAESLVNEIKSVSRSLGLMLHTRSSPLVIDQDRQKEPNPLAASSSQQQQLASSQGHLHHLDPSGGLHHR